MELTDFDKELLEMTTIPEVVLQKLKDMFGLPIVQYFGYDDDEIDYVPYDGVCVDFGEAKASGGELRSWVSQLNAFFMQENLPYAAFCSEYFIQLSEGNDCIAVVKREDAFSPIRAAGTAGFDAGISNNDIIDTVIRWQDQYGFEVRVIYADMQELEFEFVKKPQDFTAMAQALAEEIHNFSPDLVERLENGEDDLVTLMTDENTFSLYWE